MSKVPQSQVIGATKVPDSEKADGYRMFTPSEPDMSPQAKAVHSFTRWAILQYIQHLETDSIVAHLRSRLFEEACGAAEREFPRVGLDTEVLLSDGYSSIPYVWAIQRAKKDDAVTAEALWDQVRKHLQKDTNAAASLRMSPDRPLDSQQLDALSRLLAAFETQLDEILSEGNGLAVHIGWIEDRQDRQMLGYGGYLGDKPSLLLKALRSRRNPLPIWEIVHDGGRFIVAVVPAPLQTPVEQWFVVRQSKYPRMSLPLAFLVDQPTASDHEQIGTALGLMLMKVTEHSSGNMDLYDGVLTYVSHSLMLQDQGE